VLGAPVKVDGRLDFEMTPRRGLGQHTDEVLEQLANYSSASSRSFGGLA
jgi:hypothetical protein